MQFVRPTFTQSYIPYMPEKDFLLVVCNCITSVLLYLLQEPTKILSANPFNCETAADMADTVSAHSVFFRMARGIIKQFERPPIKFIM